MAFYEVVEYDVKWGKFREAVGQANTIAAYYKETLGANVEVLAPMSGEGGKLSAVFRFENLADSEELSNKARNDQELSSMLNSASDLFTGARSFWYSTV